MQFFNISEDDLQQVVHEGLSQGADYVDIYLEHASNISVNLLPEGENRAMLNFDCGAGVRLVCQDRTGYAYTEEITPARLREAVQQAAGINPLRGQRKTSPFTAHPLSDNPAHRLYPTSGYPFQPEEAQIEQMVQYLGQLRELLLSADGDIIQVSGSIRHQVKRVGIVNSVGSCCEEMRPMTSVSITAVIQRNGITESAGCSRSYRRSLDMLDAPLQTEIRDEVLRKLHFALTATQPQGGEMPVVMGAGASGILLHEAIGHAFEADFIRRGESIFTDRLGQKICDASITVVDDGLLPDMRGSIHFDDEGTPSQCTSIVTEGVLTSFLHDRISAQHFGISPTGNGRRESFRSIPLPRMRNTYMLNGNCTEESIIADVRRGIYVTDFTNGQVQIGAGDYSFFVKAGYLIEEGRLTAPIKDVNVIGNGPQTLSDIRAVANNSLVDPSTWTCGKEGQGCPVSCGMPSVLVEKLTVG